MKPLFEALLTIDAKKNGKNYALLIPVSQKKMKTAKLKSKLSFITENEDGTEGDLQPIPEDSDAEWDMTEASLQLLYGE